MRWSPALPRRIGLGGRRPRSYIGLELAEKQSSGAAAVIQICADGVMTPGLFSSKL
jgi:hypothetical protein